MIGGLGCKDLTNRRLAFRKWGGVSYWALVSCPFLSTALQPVLSTSRAPPKSQRFQLRGQLRCRGGRSPGATRRLPCPNLNLR
jgi:hypothetical protein